MANQLMLSTIPQLVIGPELPQEFEQHLATLEGSQKINKTVWGLLRNSTNPVYVTAVNNGLDCVRQVLAGDEWQDQRIKDLFLARALQLTEVVKKSNELNRLSDFNNKPLEELQGLLKSHGASLEYFHLANFFEGIASIAFAKETRFGYFRSWQASKEQKETDSNGLLEFVDDTWRLVPPSKKPDQKTVCNKLSQIVKALRKREAASAIHKLSYEELLIGQVLVGQLMTNYRTYLMSEALPVGYEVFDYLIDLHQILVQQLADKRVELNPRVLKSTLSSYRVLTNVLENERFKDFYSKDEKSDLLKKTDPILKEFITFHVNGNMAANSGLSVVWEDKKKGVNLYLTGKPGEERELVVFFDGKDCFWNKLKFDKTSLEAGRGTAFGRLRGLVHAQSLDQAEQAYTTFDEIRRAKSDQIGKIKRVHFVGFGLDGCLAQLVGFRYKKMGNPLSDVSILGCAVPPYLDDAAAAHMAHEMETVPGFSCLNYGMEQDPNMRNLGLTGTLGLNYDGSSFLQVPVPQANLFAMEALKSDRRKAYMQLLECTQRMHFALRDVYVSAKTARDALAGIDKEQKKLLPAASQPLQIDDKD